MSSRTTDDYEAMAQAGIRAIIEPAFWLGHPRTHAGTFDDYFQALIGWERFRASQFGITHYCTIALSPKEANSPTLADDVFELIPHYLGKDGVVAVGEIGFDDQTAAREANAPAGRWAGTGASAISAPWRRGAVHRNNFGQKLQNPARSAQAGSILDRRG